MSRRDPTERLLDRVAELRKERPPSSELGVELAELLGQRSAHVVASAARLAGDRGLSELTPDLGAAFESRLSNGAKRDPGCAAKAAIINALRQLEEYVPELYLTGSRHVQMEPVWGGTVDTAGELRGACIAGLVEIGHPDSLLEAARLLADPISTARTSAVRAVAASGQAGSEALLRLLVHRGDDEGEVMLEAFAGLLAMAPEGSLDFVVGYLDDDRPYVCDAAALALGESRLEDAFEPLRRAYDRGAADRALVLRALAMLRDARAFELLLEVVANGDAQSATAAIEALAMRRGDRALCESVRSAAAARDEPSVSRALGKLDR